MQQDVQGFPGLTSETILCTKLQDVQGFPGLTSETILCTKLLIQWDDSKTRVYVLPERPGKGLNLGSPVLIQTSSHSRFAQWSQPAVWQRSNRRETQPMQQSRKTTNPALLFSSLWHGTQF